MHQFGEPEEVMRLEEVPVPVAGPGELLVRVAAATLNFNDVDGVRGRYRTVRPPLPYTPGMEVLGYVEGAGTGAEGWLGKRVVAVPNGAFGGYAELAVGPAAMAFEMPAESELADAPAAAVYFPFHVSWLALHERAKVRAGETVLIHAAAGGVGSAAVQAGHVGRRTGDRDGRIGGESRVLPVPRCRRGDQLPRHRLRAGGPPCDGRPWGRRGVRLARR